MEQPLDKFDLIATQYALSMLVGRDLDLLGMWRKFLPPALKLLGCRAGHLWLHDAVSDTADAATFNYPRLAFAAMPQLAPPVAQAMQLRQSEAALRATETLLEAGGLFYHLLPLGPNGFVVLQRTVPLPHHLVQMLKPILARLADSSLACMQHAFSEKVRRDNERARIVFESIGDAVIVTDIAGRVEHLNSVAQSILGCAQNCAVGKPLNDVFTIFDEKTGTELNPVAAVLREGRALDLKNQMVLLTRDGRRVQVEDSAAPVKDSLGNISGVVLVFHDVTEQKRAQQQIEHQANYDDLTGLPNRRLFTDRLRQAMKESHRSGLPLALLFLDLDLFKEVNDTLGHTMGDLLLKQAARRLGDCVRETDTVARLSGDEFTILLTGLSDPTMVERVADMVCASLAEPFLLADEQVFISASTGITFYPDDAVAIDDMFKFADQAMYAAKASGRNRYHYFTPALQQEAESRMRIVRDLRTALTEQQFEVYFQPIIELSTGHIHKAEALIRWHHPQRGLVNPDKFICIAEEIGLIHEIGDWVFHQAAQLTLHLRQNGHPAFQVGVNKSPIQFHNEQDNFATWLELLRKLGLPGSSVLVEITEGLLLDSDVTRHLLAMRDAGVQVALDDFGTGYSSLSYLKKYDIDYLKIDQSFVRDMTRDHDDQVLCEAIIVMAHKLGLKVVAEGVETAQQRDLLTTMKCDYAQGFLFSKPVPALEFERLLG